MYNELRRELDGILLSQDLASRLNVAPCSLNFQIEEPIDRQFGLLASNVAFILSKKLKEREGVMLSPQLIAQNISQLISSDNFGVSVGGGGFINVNPKMEFIRNYLSSIPSPLNFEIPVEWNSVTMREKIKLSDEGKYLLKELSKRSSDLSRSDSLQLLSVLGDSELDSNPYLRGFNGRENTPSFILKFERFSNHLPPPKGELALNDLEPFMERLLLFRGRLDESVSREHPERVMTLVLTLIRDFFSIYNRPAIRRQILEDEKIPFLFHARSCGKQVLTALNALKFSCQLPRDVL